MYSELVYWFRLNDELTWITGPRENATVILDAEKELNYCLSRRNQSLFLWLPIVYYIVCDRVVFKKDD